MVISTLQKLNSTAVWRDQRFQRKLWRSSLRYKSLGRIYKILLYATTGYSLYFAGCEKYTSQVSNCRSIGKIL